jgi:hypothetical protein
VIAASVDPIERRIATDILPAPSTFAPSQDVLRWLEKL